MHGSPRTTESHNTTVRLYTELSIFLDDFELARKKYDVLLFFVRTNLSMSRLILRQP